MQNTIEENILHKSDQKRQLDWLAIQSGGFNTDFLAKLNIRDFFGAGAGGGPGGGGGGGGAGGSGLSADEVKVGSVAVGGCGRGRMFAPVFARAGAVVGSRRVGALCGRGQRVCVWCMLVGRSWRVGVRCRAWLLPLVRARSPEPWTLSKTLTMRRRHSAAPRTSRTPPPPPRPSARWPPRWTSSPRCGRRQALLHALPRLGL